MRVIQYSAGWQPLDSAPMDKDVTFDRIPPASIS